MTLLDEVVSVAKSQVGVREEGGNNRGPVVDTYLRVVGLNPALGSYPWCAAFAFYCYATAAIHLAVSNPLPRRASVLKLFSAVPPEWLTQNLSQVPVGAIFGIDHGQGKGHCGIVVAPLADGWLATVEGNTNEAGGRLGDGVYARLRKPESMTLGFIVPARVGSEVTG